jgi:hypothetical protein
VSGPTRSASSTAVQEVRPGSNAVLTVALDDEV